MNAVTRRPDARQICGSLGGVREPWRRTNTSSSMPGGKSARGNCRRGRRRSRRDVSYRAVDGRIRAQPVHQKVRMSLEQSRQSPPVLGRPPDRGPDQEPQRITPDPSRFPCQSSVACFFRR